MLSVTVSLTEISPSIISSELKKRKQTKKITLIK